MASTGSFQTLLGIWSVCESGRKVNCITVLYRCQILNKVRGANASKNKNRVKGCFVFPASQQQQEPGAGRKNKRSFSLWQPGWVTHSK